MERKFARRLVIALVKAGTFAAQHANADIINFSAEGVPPGPSVAGAATASTLDITTPIGSVVFSGGAVLTDAVTAPADEGAVYFTSSFCCGTGTRPNTLTITFPQNINNFFVDLYNGQTSAGVFTASDNSGASTTVTIPSNTSSGTALISFPALGDIVTITTADPSYDFFIDNIGFDQQASGVPVPELASLVFLGSGLAGVSLVRRRRRVK